MPLGAPSSQGMSAVFLGKGLSCNATFCAPPPKWCLEYQSSCCTQYWLIWDSQFASLRLILETKLEYIYSNIQMSEWILKEICRHISLTLLQRKFVTTNQKEAHHNFLFVPVIVKNFLSLSSKLSLYLLR